METPYVFGRDRFDELAIRSHFPERTPRESSIIRDWMNARGRDYDRIAFSVRIGQGLEPNPEHIPAIRDMTRYNSRMRIDVLAWIGAQPEIIEVKERVLASVLGQLLAYQQLFMEENPDARPPRLTAIGRYSTADTMRVLEANGVTVYLYDPPAGAVTV